MTVRVYKTFHKQVSCMSEEQMSDSTFGRLFVIMIIVMTIMTAIIVAIASFAASDVNAKLDERSDAENTAALAERIAPVGKFAAITSDTTNKTADTPVNNVLSGKDAYSSCAACHASGVAGAPKFGLAEAWNERITKGKETLYTNAINGFQGPQGYMPAKGGNSSLSDESIKAAVDYMIEAIK